MRRRAKDLAPAHLRKFVRYELARVVDMMSYTLGIHPARLTKKPDLLAEAERLIALLPSDCELRFDVGIVDRQTAYTYWTPSTEADVRKVLPLDAVPDGVREQIIREAVRTWPRACVKDYGGRRAPVSRITETGVLHAKLNGVPVKMRYHPGGAERGYWVETPRNGHRIWRLHITRPVYTQNPNYA